LTMRLVVGNEFIAEGGARRIEHVDQIVGPKIVAKEKQIAREAEDNVRRPAVGRVHGRNRVEELMDKRVGIHQH